MQLKILQIEEVDRLIPCLIELAMYHNRVSNNFKNCYPSVDYEITIERFKKQLLNKESVLAVIGEEDIFGFCKIDMIDPTGKLDYLFIQELHRGKGYGKLLMDWAIKMFKESNCSRVEVKVVDGNEAINFYEKFGFKINAHILQKSVD